jgi:hypothetical protein
MGYSTIAIFSQLQTVQDVFFGGFRAGGCRGARNTETALRSLSVVSGYRQQENSPEVSKSSFGHFRAPIKSLWILVEPNNRKKVKIFSFFQP